MDLRYSDSDEAFRRELRAWLADAVPKHGPAPSEKENWDSRRVYDTAWQRKLFDADQINERFHELVGDDYTVKDLRTWTATVHAAVALAKAEPPETKKATKAAVKAMLTDVSDHLGNTRQSPRAPRAASCVDHGGIGRGPHGVCRYSAHGQA